MAWARVPYAESGSGASTSGAARNGCLFRLGSGCSICRRCSRWMSCYGPLRPTISDLLSRTLKEPTSFVFASKHPQHRSLGEEAVVAAWGWREMPRRRCFHRLRRVEQPAEVFPLLLNTLKKLFLPVAHEIPFVFSEVHFDTRGDRPQSARVARRVRLGLFL